MKGKENKVFLDALYELEKEKGMDREELLNSIENALYVAYRKQYKDADNAEVVINRNTGDVKIYAKKIVVESGNIENESTEIELANAQLLKKSIKVGDEILVEIDAENFKRTAIQNAKQIVIQKVREFEKLHVYRTFKNIEHKLVSADIRKIDENGNLYVEINTQEAIIPRLELTDLDKKYKPGDKILVYIGNVEEGSKYNKVTITRKSPELVVKLFEQEVPEIEMGLIEIKSIAREAGSRSKIAVYTEDPNLDIKGACIGKNGSRITNIINELNGEKIDVILWDNDLRYFVKNALSPAEINSIEIVKVDDELIAKVEVPKSQLSLAIGKKGQNTRLATKLCDVKIEIFTLDDNDDVEISEEIDEEVENIE